MNLYLDNAATSFPKPESVYNAMNDYMIKVGANPGRGVSNISFCGNKLVFNCRNEIASFFNFDNPQNVVFTSNITESLNVLIQGIATPGCHIITSAMDHNSTLRPLSYLKSIGMIELDIVPCTETGELLVDQFKKYIKPNTRAVFLSHASNIVGTIQPLEAIGKICKELNIFFVVDTAQTAGVLPIDFKSLNCNALAFTGHKSLLGPQGIGGFLIDDKMNSVCKPLIYGGTGSLSSDVIQPDFMPDKFESGTLNTPGIAGLLAGIKFINETGITNILEHESKLTKRFIDGCLNIPTIKVYGTKDVEKQTSTVSINSSLIDNSELGYLLDLEYGIATRTGLHCAPMAHKSIGTYPAGTLRFSFGYFNSTEDVDYALSSLDKIIKQRL